MSDADDTDLIPEPAPEQEVDHLPDNDPGTDDLDPDEQGLDLHEQTPEDPA